MTNYTEHIKAKVGTDLKRIQRFYDKPSDEEIDEYEKELKAFLDKGFLKDVIYGFKRNGIFIEPSLKFSAKELFLSGGSDEDPGKILPGADIDEANFTSFLTYSDQWTSASESEKEAFKKTLPFQRVEGPVPGIDGYFSQDKTYSSGSMSMNRSSLRKPRL